MGGTLSLYVEKMTDTKIVFNGDTASGRAQWVPWLRSLALTLDEWAWSVLQNDVLPHGKVLLVWHPTPVVWPENQKRHDPTTGRGRLVSWCSKLTCTE